MVRRRARRTLFWLHRWLGIALALLMLLWTLSGFVMMYVGYPQTSAAERAAGLDPLRLGACCVHTALPDELASATVEMLAGRPVLRWAGTQGPALAWLDAPGFPTIGTREAGEVARRFMRNAFHTAPAMRLEPLAVDQWTLQLRRYAPLYKASFADARGTELYVSGLTGQVVQDTHRAERLWNWLGAVPHWLYFTALRQNGALWSQVVIYASLLGTFLTLTGLYLGLISWRRGKGWSPYRGIARWHHGTGLVFGLATLTWVFSGFVSMNPWGWLESAGPGAIPARLAGRALHPADAGALATALAAHPPAGVVSAEAVVEHGRVYAILVRRDGARTRAALPNLAPAPPSHAQLRALAAAARPRVPIASQGLIAVGDAYHYAHHSTPAILPAWRVIYADADATRLYLDPRTGEGIDYVDGPTRRFRWWHSGLHRLDLPGLRQRPLWDAVMLVLLAGVTLVCALGACLGWRRLTRRKPT